MYNGLSTKNGLFSAGFVVMTVSVGASGADYATWLVSVSEQPDKINASAVLSASDNVVFMSKLPFFYAKGQLAILPQSPSRCLNW